MRLLAQVVKLCFWALPLQRLVTVAGLGVMLFATLGLAPGEQSGRVAGLASLGLFIALLPPLALGGPLWRALTAQGMVSLAPGARGKLLLAALAMIGLCALALTFALSFDVSLRWMPMHGLPLAVYVTVFTSAFAFGSWWIIACFLAARSALALLAVFAIVLACAYAMAVLDLPGPLALLMATSRLFTAALWAVFGLWYLRARRVARSAWFSQGGSEALLVTGADTGGLRRHHSVAAARERLLFRGPDRIRILLQWVVAVALLLGMQGAWARIGKPGEPERTAQALFASLPLLLAGMALAADSAAARLRSLWLSGGLSRAQLFALAERQCGGLALGFALLGAGYYLLLWWLMPWHPPVHAAWGIAALIAGLMVPAYAALWGRDGWRWLAAGLVLVPLVETYWRVCLGGNDFNPAWLLVPVAATLALRWAARRRWLEGDMPRAISAPAS